MFSPRVEPGEDAETSWSKFCKIDDMYDDDNNNMANNNNNGDKENLLIVQLQRTLSQLSVKSRLVPTARSDLNIATMVTLINI